LFGALVRVRSSLYRRGWLRSYSLPVPVVVVGNLTVGGAGKTPLALWLVERLREEGWRPGIISRGYRGAAEGAQAVAPGGDPLLVGDEPLLLARRSGVPVFVGRDRVGAGQALLGAHPECDILVSDDGLQHYRLQRDIELAVIDAASGLGNGWPLPAGPLREPRRRLQSVDAVIQVVRGAAQPHPYPQLASWRADYTAGQAWRLRAPQDKQPLRDLPPRDWIAATGIGRPQGFFDMLAAHGINFTPHAFADHHAFRPQDLPADGAVLMTEKDAVKCQSFAGTDWWAVTLEVAPETGFADWLGTRLKQ